ncbi:hypothetical protein MTP99_010008 [Tenebrio molitor]|jgi:hypothetical protein|nr:hypothetical protein MTP99_010008 [Tenebrio molitor]
MDSSLGGRAYESKFQIGQILPKIIQLWASTKPDRSEPKAATQASVWCHLEIGTPRSRTNLHHPTSRFALSGIDNFLSASVLTLRNANSAIEVPCIFLFLVFAGVRVSDDSHTELDLETENSPAACYFRLYHTYDTCAPRRNANSHNIDQTQT